MEEPSATSHPGEGSPAASARECPECGAVLLHTNGCVLCGQCGYSPCD